MIEPIDSKFDDDPYVPPAEGEEGNDREGPLPPLGTPELEVAWSTRPSFNDEPKPIDHMPEGATGVGPATSGDESEGFHIDLRNLGSTVNGMLGEARLLVDQYETLKDRVNATRGYIFGQEAQVNQDWGKTDFSTDTIYEGFGGDDPKPSSMQEPARKFAEEFNPYQDQALRKIAQVLTFVGEYIAMLNHSGQVYAAADRKSRFPDPPAQHSLL
jgi:hypothetical protein